MMDHDSLRFNTLDVSGSKG